MRVALVALLFAALVGSALCQDPIVTNDEGEGDLATNTDSEEMPDMSQFENEEILLNSKDVFQGSTLLQLLPDVNLDSLDEIVPQDDGNGTDSKCCKCTEFAAKKVLEHVIAHVKQMCDQTKCPHIKKHCEWMGKHPKFALGTMIYHVRPHSLGFSYCLGKGKCHHYEWDEVTDRSPLIVDPLSVELLVEMAERNRTFAEDITTDLTDEDVAELEERIREIVPDDDENVAFPTDESCHKCVHWISLHVVRRHIEGFVELCKKTKCPKIKEHCKWAFHNFSLWLGFNTAWIRPEEFSHGYCVGKDACSPRFRHRHAADEFNQ